MRPSRPSASSASPCVKVVGIASRPRWAAPSRSIRVRGPPGKPKSQDQANQRPSDRKTRGFRRFGRVAQRIRAPGFGPGGWGFEPLRACFSFSVIPQYGWSSRPKAQWTSARLRTWRLRVRVPLGRLVRESYGATPACRAGDHGFDSHTDRGASSSCFWCLGPIAQSVEHPTLNRTVASSILAGSIMVADPEVGEGRDCDSRASEFEPHQSPSCQTRCACDRNLPVRFPEDPKLTGESPAFNWVGGVRVPTGPFTDMKPIGEAPARHAGCRGFESLHVHRVQRGVGQLGRSPALGAGNRQFESDHLDHRSLRGRAVR